MLNTDKLQTWISGQGIHLQPGTTHSARYLQGHRIFQDSDTYKDMVSTGLFTLSFVQLWGSDEEDPAAILQPEEWAEVEEAGTFIDPQSGEVIQLASFFASFHLVVTQKLLDLRPPLPLWVKVAPGEIPSVPYRAGHLDMSKPFGRTVARWILSARGAPTETDDPTELAGLLGVPRA